MVEFGIPRIILPSDARTTSNAVALDITAYGKSRDFLIALGYLTEVQADALVFRALPGFGPSAFGGVYSDLKINAGVGIFYEAQTKAEQLSKTEGIDNGIYKQLPQGCAISTTSGGLSERYKNIIHVNLIIKKTDLDTERVDAVKTSVVNSLKEADRLCLKSLAYPAIGAYSGVLLDECLLGILTGVRTFYEDERPDPALNKILFVMHGEPSLENAQVAIELVEKQLSKLR